MSKVKLFDGNELLINERQADALEQSLSDSNDGYVKINGNMVKKTAISSVMKGSFYDSDIADYSKPAIPSGKVCRGEFSIQNEINNIAKASGQGWAKRVMDKTWREKTRLKLRASTEEWCDAKAGTCHCA
jgi:hypothetical protein